MEQHPERVGVTLRDGDIPRQHRVLGPSGDREDDVAGLALGLHVAVRLDVGGEHDDERTTAPSLTLGRRATRATR
jgi:hypothetical protein